MIDLNEIRNDPNLIVKKLKKRNFDFDEKFFISSENERKKIQILTEDLQSKRNKISKEIGAKKKEGEDISIMMEEVSKINEDLKKLTIDLEQIQTKLKNYLLNVPNLCHESVPEGIDENYNKVIRTVGEKPNFDFTVLDHSDLGKKNEMIDFDLGSKISGSRFTVLSGNFAKLHRALKNFMIDVHTKEHGYEEVNVPYIVNSESLHGTGQLPKFEMDLFKIESKDNDFYLIPTAEVPVTNIVRNRIVNFSDLPIKYVCHSPCFRSEAGSYGKDTKGMIRQHQFEKVELVQIISPSESYEALEQLTSNAESILKKLKLHYRVSLLCTGDTGFSSSKTYDLEVWLPSQNTYREISSCSNFEDFQSRRMLARSKIDGKMQFLHTINGSGLAIGRTLVAVIENYQQKDGSIQIPDVLIDYMDGQKVINL